MTAATWKPEDTFATRLRLVRHEKNISAQELADHLGVNRNTILHWERGMDPKNMGKMVSKISTKYGVDPFWLMWGDENLVGQAGLEPATERLWFETEPQLLYSV